MDMSRFKLVIRRLSVVRRHSSLFVPVLIGLVGVFLFIPAQLMSVKLKRQMFQESVTDRGRQVTSLRQSAVSNDQWLVEHERQQAFKNDANQIMILAEELTKRPLLSEKIFPSPTDASISIFRQFGQRFREGVNEMLRLVKAGECPTEEELKRSLGAVSGRRSRTGRDRKKLSGADDEIREALCLSKAEAANVYCSSLDMSGYEFWGEYQYAGTDEAVEDCWYYQLAYWIIEDIFDTIESVNSSSNSVFESPLKRLLGVDFHNVWMTTSSSGKTKGERPSYVLTIYEGLTVPYTLRVCDGDIDVVHFNVRVVVAADAVLQFTRQLCSAKEHIGRGSNGHIQGAKYAKHNQITILETRITAIDREDEAHSLYRYGEDAVVELSLICEYVFSTKGYDELKPVSIKTKQLVPTLPIGVGRDSRRVPVRTPSKKAME
jgi:hypothetical protein